MTEVICTNCPQGCHLQVDEENNYAVTGNRCKRGAIYGPQELQHPARIVTSTVAIAEAAHPTLPVKTAREVPKELIADVMCAIKTVQVIAPIHMGDVVLANVCDTGVDVVATRSL